MTIPNKLEAYEDHCNRPQMIELHFLPPASQTWIWHSPVQFCSTSVFRGSWPCSCPPPHRLECLSLAYQSGNSLRSFFKDKGSCHSQLEITTSPILPQLAFTFTSFSVVLHINLSLLTGGPQEPLSSRDQDLCLRHHSIPECLYKNAQPMQWSQRYFSHEWIH